MLNWKPEEFFHPIARNGLTATLPFESLSSNPPSRIADYGIRRTIQERIGLSFGTALGGVSSETFNGQAKRSR